MCHHTLCPQISTARDWNNHHKKFHGTTLWCNICQRGFKTPSAQRDHAYIHKLQQFTCNKCNKTFCFPSTLQVHSISHHKVKMFKCTVAGCKWEYKYRHDLLQHNKCHEHVRYSCEQCDYVSRERRLLKHHMVQHSEKRLFRCNKCGKKYKHYNSLNRHSKKCTRWVHVHDIKYIKYMQILLHCSIIITNLCFIWTSLWLYPIMELRGTWIHVKSSINESYTYMAWLNSKIWHQLLKFITYIKSILMSIDPWYFVTLINEI